MENDLRNIRYLLETELILKRKVRSFAYHDKSITHDDIVNECWLRLIKNDLTVTLKNLLKVLKDYFKTIRNNSHCSLIEEFLDIEDIELVDEDLEEAMLKFSDTLNLTEYEQLVLLYIQDKSNLKRYNYAFILRKNGTGVDASKINHYLISINNKLMAKIKNDFIKNYNRGE